MNTAVAQDEDDVGKTVVGSAIDSDAIKKAQAELVERKRLKDAEQKMSAQQTLMSQAKLKPEAAGGSNTMMIVVVVVVVALAAVAAVVLM